MAKITTAAPKQQSTDGKKVVPQPTFALSEGGQVVATLPDLSSAELERSSTGKTDQLYYSAGVVRVESNGQKLPLQLEDGRKLRFAFRVFVDSPEIAAEREAAKAEGSAAPKKGAKKGKK